MSVKGQADSFAQIVQEGRVPPTRRARLARMLDIVMTRLRRCRLREVYRSAGWPCLDTVEIERLVERVARAMTPPRARSMSRARRRCALQMPFGL